MDIQLARRASEEVFARAVSAASGSETTPATISPQITALSASLNAERPLFVPVRHDPCGLYGFCNVGVLEKVKSAGGSIMFGWNIWEYPRIFLTAEFHAVWADPNGDLMDITPKPDGETQILFAADPSYSADFDFKTRPPNRRVRLYQPADRSALAAATIGAFNERQMKYESGRALKKGMTLEQWIESKISIDSLPGLIDRYLSTADEMDTLWRPRADGVGTVCTNPTRLRELGLPQSERMARIKVLMG